MKYAPDMYIQKYFGSFWCGLLCMLLLVALVPLQGQAQLGLITGEPLLLETSPRLPTPESVVRVQLTSYQFDLNQVAITWVVDGVTRASDENKTEIIVTAPESGARMVVEVFVQDQTGGFYKKQIVINPASVSIAWEADTYTPPFYRGKALASAGSTVTLIALPDIRTTSGKKLSAEELIFTWEQNGRVIPGSSGRGKNTVTMPGPEVYRNIEVLLNVRTLDESTGAIASVVIPAHTPLVLLYENHPTLGIRFEEGYGANALSLENNEVTLSAQPYFFSTGEARSPQMSYTWSINRAKTENPNADQSSIVLRPTGSGGEAYVEVSATHTSRIFQQARRALSITFNQEPGIFGI